MTPPIRCDRIRCAYSASFYTGEFLILYRSRFQFSLKGVWSLIMHRRPTLFPGSRGTLMAIRGDLGNNLLRSVFINVISPEFFNLSIKGFHLVIVCKDKYRCFS